MPSEVVVDQAGLQDLYDGLMEHFLETPLREPHEAEMGEIEAETKQRFADGVQPDGSPQPPLAASTIRRKGHDRILQDTNRLMESLTDRSHPDAIAEIVDEPRQGGITRGSAVPYGPGHNRASGNRPARPHVGITVDGVDRYGNRVIDHAFRHLTEP